MSSQLNDACSPPVAGSGIGSQRRELAHIEMEFPWIRGEKERKNKGTVVGRWVRCSSFVAFDSRLLPRERNDRVPRSPRTSAGKYRNNPREIDGARRSHSRFMIKLRIWRGRALAGPLARATFSIKPGPLFPAAVHASRDYRSRKFRGGKFDDVL